MTEELEYFGCHSFRSQNKKRRKSSLVNCMGGENSNKFRPQNTRKNRAVQGCNSKMTFAVFAGPDTHSFKLERFLTLITIEVLIDKSYSYSIGGSQ